MARFLSFRLLAIGAGAFGSLVSLAACTALLGDFEVSASNVAPDTGGPDTTTEVDGGEDAPADVQPDAKPNGLSGVRAIAAGSRHTCAIVNAGEVFCWGDNAQGQLAQPGTITRLAKPRKVNLTGVATKIATSGNHTCVIMMNGDINCWGANASGQSGTGNQMSPAPPHVVMTNPAKQWEEVSPGAEHTCAVDQGGQVYCWGANNSNQSGTIAASTFVPTAAGGEKAPFGSLAASVNHTCARVLNTTGMRCWGTEDKGALGNGLPANDSSQTALAVVGTQEIKQVAVGGGHSCSLDATGDFRCWGDNTFGQLGVTPAGGVLDAPAAKIGMQPLAAISAGGATSCGVAVMNRTLACVGSNASGQLGRGGSKDTSPHPDVQAVLRPDGSGQPLEGVAFVSVGRDHVCAVVGTGGDLFCWGEGADGQVGDALGGQPRTLPVRVGLPE
jgi:alpha-tubulin suppressor-like RCC1 family protein